MKALDRKVWLPSGGSLVIDRTEAMTVVDVNTGKFVGSGGNLEQTVTRNNMEAAEEIVRQLRLRDIGGIIVIDFIDMVLESNRDLVLRRLTECLGRDRTKHQVAEVTSLGLVQMTRKRVGQGLLEVFSEPCEHCRGRGVIVSTDPVDEKRRSGGPAAERRRERPAATAADVGTVPRDAKEAGSDGTAERPAPAEETAAGRAGRRGRRGDRGHPHRRTAQPRTPRTRSVRRGPGGRGRRRPLRRADRRRARPRDAGDASRPHRSRSDGRAPAGRAAGRAGRAAARRCRRRSRRPARSRERHRRCREPSSVEAQPAMRPTASPAAARPARPAGRAASRPGGPPLRGLTGPASGEARQCT